MEAIPLPNQPQITELEKNKYSIAVEPLYPGYGYTIGNAMRRVLLSSMPGAAVTAIKIKFVDHEFSTIPNVKEDVIQIILNLKQLRVKSFSHEPVKIYLKVKGEKAVTAADIKETDQVQVVNKDLHIATLDNKSAEFDMEMVVEQGRGYLPVEARENQKLELGMIALDAMFSPVRSVHFDVTNVRVGQFTNYEKLEVVMETDGTINGEEAMNISSHVLVDHFTMMFTSNFTQSAQQPAGTAVSAEAAEQPLSETEAPALENEIQASTLSTRSKNALTKNNITSIEALKNLSTGQINNMDGLGDKSIKEILDFLGRQQENK
jgi:DNA-directed RNA polymerase subunit alpha